MKTSKLKILYFFFSMIFLSFLTTSCSERPFYDQAYSFDDGVWNKNDTARFIVPVDDTINEYKFILTLRTTVNYQYSDLWAYVMITAPDESVSKMAQRIPLANTDGSWIGRVSGTVVESRLKFDSAQFPLKGDYIFEIVKATQRDKIEEVLDVSLRIEENF
ncbi:MAG: gliding motility lipoprotein GldH [Brumimicrobium sp.]|nr:gliding motility lipoprotein GldH [Brumimicrobium sp.]